jgi:putative membrane protein
MDKRLTAGRRSVYMSYESTERRAWVLSLVVSAVALGLIGASSRGGIDAVPKLPGPVITAIPHVNAVLVAAAFVTVLAGYREIRRGNVVQHARLMATTTALFFVFLALYLVRLSNAGLTEFPGPETFYTYVYLPFLGVHMVLAAVCIPLVLYSVFVAATVPTDDIRETAHPRVGRVAVPLWATSFAFGFVVYLMLHHLF